MKVIEGSEASCRARSLSYQAHADLNAAQKHLHYLLLRRNQRNLFVLGSSALSFEEEEEGRGGEEGVSGLLSYLHNN